MSVKKEHRLAATEESERARTALAANLKKWRVNADLSQSDLADSADVSVSYVSMIERGQRFPTMEVLVLLCTVLGKRWQDAFRGDYERPAQAAV